MKILIVSSYLSTSKSLSFYQSQQINLAGEIYKLGYDISILAGKRQNSDPDKLTIDNINIEILTTYKFLPESLFNQTIIKGLWSKLKFINPDIIHTSEYQTLTTLIISLYSIIFKKKMIIYQGIHNDSDKLLVRILSKIWDFFLGNLIIKATSICVCKTSAAIKYMKSKGFEKLSLIPVGVNIKDFNYQTTHKPNDEINFLVVGNLIPLKNHDLIINVMSSLLKKGVKFKLKIIGKGFLKDYLINLIKKNNLIEFVEIIENIPNSKMKLYYCFADYTLSFSKKEIFGMTILESLSCGTPVISNYTPGPVDVIEDGINGFKIKEQSAEEISSKLINVFKNNKFNKSEISLQTQHKYSWSVIAKKYEILYKQLPFQ